MINLSEITLLGAGNKRKTSGKSKSNGDGSRSFDLSYRHYTKTTKKGINVPISTFFFSNKGLTKTELSNAAFAAAVSEVDNDIILVVLPSTHEQATILQAPKRGNKKSNLVSIPTLVNFLIEKGMINAEFEGTHFFNLELVPSETDEATFYKVVAAPIPARPYNSKEENTTSSGEGIPVSE